MPQPMNPAMTPPDLHTPWPAEAIWEQVFPLLPDFTVEILPEIDSTNSELMRRARAGQHEPTLLVAERQSAGRGRMGRVWQSQAGDSLTFSLSLPMSPQDWSGLSLAVGLSLAESLHAEVGLKWPNDLWFQSRKLGGILVEAASMGGRSQVVIGVGLNIRPRPAEGLSTAPAALTELLPQLTAPACLSQVVPPLIRAMLDFEHTGFAPLLSRFEVRDVLKGQRVHTSDGQQGLCLGLTPGGDPQRRSQRATLAQGHLFMMRWLFGFLLLCNAVALAWQRDVFDRWGWGPNVKREPERLQQQIRPEAVTLTLPPRPAASESAAAPSPAPGLDASTPSPAEASQDAGSVPASPAASQALTTSAATPTAAPSSTPSTPAAVRSDAKAVR
eukprot:gene23663-29905_t